MDSPLYEELCKRTRDMNEAETEEMMISVITLQQHSISVEDILSNVEKMNNGELSVADLSTEMISLMVGQKFMKNNQFLSSIMDAFGSVDSTNL